MLEVYTDGSYSSNRNQGGWSFVVIDNNKKIYSDYGGVLNTTNNRMEIQSVIEAIKYLSSQNILDFVIYSDSMYVIGTMSKNWRRKKNSDLWEELDNLILDKNIEWKHVKGHSSDKWNNHCDMLAVHGSQINLNI